MSETAWRSALPGYEDWPAYIQQTPVHKTGAPAPQELAEALGVPAGGKVPAVTVHWEETHDGVTTSQLTWQLGFGPRSSGWLVRPEGSNGPLPGILALHCHGGNKFGGADRLVDLPADHDTASPARDARAVHYEGRALASEIARRGFVVLAHDAFGWGSRRFDLSRPPRRTAEALEAKEAQWRQDGVVPSASERYNAAAAAHEGTIAKAAGLLGTSMAGTVAHDDLAALDILALLPSVDPGRLGCVGFSGGGGRALVLAALDSRIRSYVVTCMMTTFQSLLPTYVDAHSWLLQTPGLWKLGDWPELSLRSAAKGFLVQYALADELFPEAGMREADRMLLRLNPKAYTGSFWPGGHIFTAAMQDEAIRYLQTSLGADTNSSRPFPQPSRMH